VSTGESYMELEIPNVNHLLSGIHCRKSMNCGHRRFQGKMMILRQSEIRPS